jgi:hypothetical protein
MATIKIAPLAFGFELLKNQKLAIKCAVDNPGGATSV